MRTYFTFNEFEPKFPEQFKTLKTELSMLGTIHCTDKELEHMYETFSKEKFTISWMDVESRVYTYEYSTCTSIITHFAIWLSRQVEL